MPLLLLIFSPLISHQPWAKIVFGKAMTNGLNPLSGVWAREELIGPEVFPAGSTHSTFASNPLGTAVALEAVKLMDEVDYEKLTRDKGAYFLKGLKELQREHRIIGDVDGIGKITLNDLKV